MKGTTSLLKDPNTKEKMRTDYKKMEQVEQGFNNDIYKNETPDLKTIEIEGKFDIVYSDFKYRKDNNRENKSSRDLAKSGSKSNSKNKSRESFEIRENNCDEETISHSQQKLDRNCVYTRLYNHGYYLRNQLEEKRRQVYKEEKKLMNQSKMLHNSMLLVQNKSKEKVSQTINAKSQKYNNIFSHTPTINATSIKIASTLDPSTIRLTRKRASQPIAVRKTNINSINKISNYYKNVVSYAYKNKKCVNLNKSGNRSYTPQRVLDLYSNGVKKYQKCEEKFLENQKKMNESYLEYSFQPNQSKNSMLISHHIHSYKNRDEFYSKQIKWKESINNKTNANLRKHLKEEREECTFQPQISKIPKSKSEIIDVYNPSCFEYIIKRREILQKKIEDDEYKKKVFFEQSKNENNSSSNPKMVKKVLYEVELEDSSKGEEEEASKTSNNISSEKPKRKNMNKILKMRNLFQTQQYFQFKNNSQEKERIDSEAKKILRDAGIP